MIIKLNKKHGNISEQFIFYTLDASNVNKITEITDNFSINLFKQENKPRKQIGLMLKFDRFSAFRAYNSSISQKLEPGCRKIQLSLQIRITVSKINSLHQRLPVLYFHILHGMRENIFQIISGCSKLQCSLFVIRTLLCCFII